MSSSFWSSNQVGTFSHDTVTDVLIIGGGYAGLSTAFWLTELRPNLKVTILERLTCGSGATGKNAGFMTIGSAAFYYNLVNRLGVEKASSVGAFASYSVKLLFESILKFHPEIKFERSSSVTLIKNQDFIESWKTNNFIPEDFHFNWKSSRDLPDPLKSIYNGGYEASLEFKVNPLLLLNSIRGLLTLRGVDFIENEPGFEITKTGVQTSRRLIKPQKVILALNGYSSQFHSPFQNLVFPKRAQMLSARIEEDFNCPDAYYDPAEKVYWRMTHLREIIIGGKRTLDESKEVGEFEKVTPLIQKALEQYLDKLGLKYHVTNRWAGIMGFTNHELPIIDKVSSPLETYFIGGFSGHGMGLGFLSGKEMAEVCLGIKEESFFNQFKKVDCSI
jgi:glycine/D-amino acid oxidase-like deaminating enzyme